MRLTVADYRTDSWPPVSTLWPYCIAESPISSLFLKKQENTGGWRPMTLDLIATHISRSALAPGFPRNSE
jgi:hypothetical protein